MLKDPSKRHVEVLDRRPIAKPTRLKIPSQSERIMAYVRLQQHIAAQSKEVETFEEADDFEFDDGEEWFSPYEEVFEATDTSSLPDLAAGKAPVQDQRSTEVKPVTAPPSNVPRSDDGPVST